MRAGIRKGGKAIGLVGFDASARPPQAKDRGRGRGRFPARFRKRFPEPVARLRGALERAGTQWPERSQDAKRGGGGRSSASWKTADESPPLKFFLRNWPLALRTPLDAHSALR